MNAIPAIPKGLVSAIRDGNCVLFAGAGVSRGMIQGADVPQEQYLPTWGDLLVSLIDKARETDLVRAAEATKLRKAAKSGKYLFVAEAVKKILGPKEFEDALTEIFRRPGLQPTSRHELITRIPFAAVITTNYDKLLEAAYARTDEFPRSYTFQDSSDIISAISSRRFFILKAHGDIDRRDSIVLSEKDYRDIIFREPGYRAALNTIFIKDTVLFVGASLEDEDVKLVLESVSESFQGKGTIHYALVPWKDGSAAEVEHWRQYFGIHLLRYRASKGHPEVDEFLKRLRKEVGAKRNVPGA